MGRARLGRLLTAGLLPAVCSLGVEGQGAAAVAEASGRAALWVSLQGPCPISPGETVFLGHCPLICGHDGLSFPCAPACSQLTGSWRILQHLPAPRGGPLELNPLLPTPTPPRSPPREGTAPWGTWAAGSSLAGVGRSESRTPWPPIGQEAESESQQRLLWGDKDTEKPHTLSSSPTEKAHERA